MTPRIIQGMAIFTKRPIMSDLRSGPVPWLRLPGDAAREALPNLGGRQVVPRLRPPVHYRDQAGIDKLPVTEPREDLVVLTPPPRAERSSVQLLPLDRESAEFGQVGPGQP